MLQKVCTGLLILTYCSAHMINHEWDVAVAVGDEIKLLNLTGSVLGTAIEQFTELKALSYDYLHHQFLVSDMYEKNDTIFKIQLTTQHTEISAVIKNLPDDVQGLAVDPLTDILYWTDSANQTINYVSLKNSSLHSNVLIDLKGDNPQDITIDICRRYVYWTNNNIMKPTIERATLNGQKREVLLKDDLFMPTGIAIDYEADRIYWADLRQGIYFRIESIKTDGSERQVLYEGTHEKPFGVAVDSDYVYWTDVTNNELYRKNKHSDAPPECIQKFKASPRGLVVKDVSFAQLGECKDLLAAMENFKGITTEYFLADEQEIQSRDCFNRGEFIDGGCQCRRGYSGVNCEISLCYNFCLHGECHFTSLAYPQCRCPPGFLGTRCQKNVCDGFCLNNGKCSISSNSTTTPVCNCPYGYTGTRCEKSTDFSQVCETFCTKRVEGTLVDTEDKVTCRCEGTTFKVIEEIDNVTAELKSAQQTSVWQYVEEPAIIILSMCMLVMFVLIIIMASFICKLRRRPRIKKRIIVNKNVTPLTYRPHPPAEQCEITIENCCNMNVCETPCFEPPKLRNFKSKKEEKKDLLSNMENGEEVY